MFKILKISKRTFSTSKVALTLIPYCVTFPRSEEMKTERDAPRRINSIFKNSNYFIKRQGGDCGYWGYLYARRSCNPALACGACTGVHVGHERACRSRAFTLARAHGVYVCGTRGCASSRIGVHGIYVSQCMTRSNVYTSRMHTHMKRARAQFMTTSTDERARAKVCAILSLPQPPVYPWFKNIMYSTADRCALCTV